MSADELSLSLSSVQKISDQSFRKKDKLCDKHLLGDTMHYSEPCSATASMFLYAQGSSVICVHHDTLAIERKFSKHKEKVRLLAVDTISERGSGKWVASYDAGQTAIVWNCLTGDELTRFIPDQTLTAIVWTRNGTVASGNSQGKVLLFEPATSKLVSVPTIVDQIPITAIAPATECNKFAIGFANGLLIIAELEPKFKILHNLSLSETSSPVTSVAWHASSSYQKSDMLATQSLNSDLRVWSISKPNHTCNKMAKVVRVLKGSKSLKDGPSWLGWSKNGRIIQLSNNKTCSWDVRTKNVTYETVPTPENLKSLAIYGAGATLFTLGHNENIQQFDLNSPPQKVANAQHSANLKLSPCQVTLEKTTKLASLDAKNDIDAARVATEGADLAINEPSENQFSSPSTYRNRTPLASQYPASLQYNKIRTKDKSNGKKCKKNMDFASSPWLSQEKYCESNIESLSASSDSSPSESSGIFSFRRNSLRINNRGDSIDDSQPLVSDLFPFTKARLAKNLGNPITEVSDKLLSTCHDFRKQMFHILFDWKGEAQELVQDEMRKHPSRSTSKIFLARWLGEFDLENMTSISESMTSSDWMLLALSEMGKQSSPFRVAQFYVQRLLNRTDINTAATIMISMGDINDAIEIYISHEKYIEALLLVSLTYPANYFRQVQLVQRWGEWAVTCGQDQLAKRCLAVIGLNSFSGQSSGHCFPEVLSPPLSPPEVNSSRRNISLASTLKIDTSFDNENEEKSQYAERSNNFGSLICSVNEVAQIASHRPGQRSECHTPVTSRTATPNRFNRQDDYLVKGTTSRDESLCLKQQELTPKLSSTNIESKTPSLGNLKSISPPGRLHIDSVSNNKAEILCPIVKEMRDITRTPLSFLSPKKINYFDPWNNIDIKSASPDNKLGDLDIQWPHLESIITGDYMSSPISSVDSLRYRASNNSFATNCPTISSSFQIPQVFQLKSHGCNDSSGIGRSLHEYTSSHESVPNEKANKNEDSNAPHQLNEPSCQELKSVKNSRKILCVDPLSSKCRSATSQIPSSRHKGKGNDRDNISLEIDQNQDMFITNKTSRTIKRSRSKSKSSKPFPMVPEGSNIRSRRKTSSRRVASCNQLHKPALDDCQNSIKTERGRGRSRTGSNMRAPSTPTWPQYGSYEHDCDSDEDFNNFHKNTTPIRSQNYRPVSRHRSRCLSSSNSRSTSSGRRRKRTSFNCSSIWQPSRPQTSNDCCEKKSSHNRILSDARVVDPNNTKDQGSMRKEKAARELEERRKSLARRPSAPSILHPEELSKVMPAQSRPQLLTKSTDLAKKSSEVNLSEIQQLTGASQCISRVSPANYLQESHKKEGEKTKNICFGIPIGLPATPRVMKISKFEAEGKKLPPMSLQNTGKPEIITESLLEDSLNSKYHHTKRFESFAPLPKSVYKAPNNLNITPTRRISPRSASAPIPEESPISPQAPPPDLPTHPAFQATLPRSSGRRGLDLKTGCASTLQKQPRKVSSGKIIQGTLGYETKNNQFAQVCSLADTMDGIDETTEAISPPSPPSPPRLKELQHLAGPAPPPPPPPPLSTYYRPENLNTNSIVSAISSGSGIIEIVRDDLEDDPFSPDEKSEYQQPFTSNSTTAIKEPKSSLNSYYKVDSRIQSRGKREDSSSISGTSTGRLARVTAGILGSVNRGPNSEFRFKSSSPPQPRRSATTSPTNFLKGNHSRNFLPDFHFHTHHRHRRCKTNDPSYKSQLNPNSSVSTKEGGLI